MVHKARGLAFKVGLYVIFITCLSLAAVVYIGFKQDLFSERVTYYVVSTTGENVERGVPVRLSGFNIGHVSDVSLDTVDNVLITVHVLKKYQDWFKTDSKIILVQGGFIGQTYLKLVPGTEQSPVLEEDSVIKLDRVGGLEEIITEAQPVIEDLKAIVANIKNITAHFLDESGAPQQILTNIESVTSDMKEGKGLAGYLLQDPRPVERLDSLLVHTDEAIVRITNLVDQAALRVEDIGPMQQEITQLVAELRSFIQELKELRAEINPAVEDVVEITGEVRKATEDLDRLRTQGEYTIRIGTELLERLKRTWPFREGAAGPPEQEHPLP
jgi:ABC-type transporter Mla subunit MlaD